MIPLLRWISHDHGCKIKHFGSLKKISKFTPNIIGTKNIGMSQFRISDESI